MEQKIAFDDKARGGNPSSTRKVAILGTTLLVVIAVVGGFYWYITRNQISTDKADIEAPIITVGAEQAGTVQKILVQEGEFVSANGSVAQVGDEILKSKEAGLVVSAPHIVGTQVRSGDPVVLLINPTQLRLVAHIDEDNHLSDIRAGESVSFTVDAYGSKKYTGRVEEVSSTSRQSGVVFNISDQREVRQFDVKILFDVKEYPELKNGMSAKVTIYKN